MGIEDTEKREKSLAFPFFSIVQSLVRASLLVETNESLGNIVCKSFSFLPMRSRGEKDLKNESVGKQATTIPCSKERGAIWGVLALLSRHSSTEGHLPW